MWLLQSNCRRSQLKYLPRVGQHSPITAWQVNINNFIPQHDSVRSYRIYSEEPDPEEEPELGGDCVERRPKAGIASLGVCRP